MVVDFFTRPLTKGVVNFFENGIAKIPKIRGLPLTKGIEEI